MMPQIIPAGQKTKAPTNDRIESTFVPGGGVDDH
jgi:hypothetical protein